MKESLRAKKRRATPVLLLLLAGTLTIFHFSSSESPGYARELEKAAHHWTDWWSPRSEIELLSPLELERSHSDSDAMTPSQDCSSDAVSDHHMAVHTSKHPTDSIAAQSSSRFAIVDRQHVLETVSRKAMNKIALNETGSKVDVAIHSLAVAKSMSLVFDSSIQTSSGSPFLIASGRIENLTDEIISIFEIENSGDPKHPPPKSLDARANEGGP